MGSREYLERLAEAAAPHHLGDGLSLEPLNSKLAEEFSRLVEANREHLGRWMTWVWTPFPPGAALREIKRMTSNESGPWTLPFAVVRERRMVGFAQLFGIRFSIGTAEVSYWISQDESGHDAASRAVNELCWIAFRELGLHRVELRCAVDNAASLGVARKAGFTTEGVLRDAWRVGDQRQSLVMHSRLATDSA